MPHDFRWVRCVSLLAATILLLTGCDAQLLSPAGPTFDLQDGAANRPSFIVTVGEGEDPAAVAAQNGIDPVHVYTETINGFAGNVSDLARAGLMRDARVLQIVPDGIVSATEIAVSSGSWGLDRLDQRNLPLDGIYRYPGAASGVTAYVIDSGIRYDHAEFAGRAVAGYDAFKDGRNGSDCNGHGTHVAGTVGGKTFGVAPGVRLVSVRVLDCQGSGLVSQLIAGIEWVAKNHVKPAVANISISAERHNTLNQALRNLVLAGVPTSVAAANNGADACLSSPASAPEAMTVGGTTSNDTRASWSNWGSCIDLFAPGSGIRSADFTSQTGSRSKSGTSMAAPHVAGVAALLLATTPSLTSQQVSERILEMASKNAVLDARSANAHLLHHPAQVEVVLTSPTPPSSLTAALIANGVELRWIDNSSNEERFLLQRKLAGQSYSTIARLPANVVQFEDRTVQPASTYTYRVAAKNAAGRSRYSNEVTITFR